MSKYLPLFVFLITSCGLTGTHLAATSAAAGHAREKDKVLWSVLRQFEIRALRHYEHNHRNSDVKQLGHLIWNVSRWPEFLSKRESCGSAAELLSFMVTGYYYSNRRLEIAHDWLRYAKPYIRRRNACLAELRLDHSRYPLPWWFGL